MNTKQLMLLGLVLTFGSSIAFARGGGGGDHSGGHSHSGSSYSPGTGSTSSSTHVHSYTTKDGTYVPAHEKSKADHNFNNNWTTKGNDNPYTGKEGSRVTPPSQN
jgi:hypothetical protein